MPITQCCILTRSQQLRGLQNILNLTSIQVNARQLLNLVLSKILSLRKGSPDPATTLKRQALVSQTQMNARLEGRIDVINTVGSQEEEGFVVF